MGPMTEHRDPNDLYRRARSRARRTPSFLLRRRARRLVARAAAHRPHTDELAELAAVRTELVARSRGAR
jgi:hypothetical protein